MTKKPLSFKLILHGSGLEQFTNRQLKLNKPETIKLFSLPSTSLLAGFEFRIHYGHSVYKHNDETIYKLPFATNSAYRVTQSHSNISTHHLGNHYAIDWAMPEGVAVHAARGGIVVSTYSKSKKGGLNTKATANHIWIQHSDGSIGKYMHLMNQGVYVSEGQNISAGDFIGAAGNTGYSSGSHLHFSVSTLSEFELTPATQTLYSTHNVKFKTHSGIQTIENGITYRH